jgi:hypothetical protein
VVGARFGFTAAFAVAPTAMMTHLFGTPGASGTARAVAIVYAVRDFGLGVGLLRALRSRRGARAWMLAGTVADIVDLCTVAAFLGAPPAGRQSLVAGMAAIVAIDTVLTMTVDGLPVRRGRDTVDSGPPAGSPPSGRIP